MPTDRRELAYQAFFALIEASSYFGFKERMASVELEEVTDMPAAVVIDGGETVTDREATKIHPDAEVSVVVVTAADQRQDLPAALNEARAKCLQAVAAWATGSFASLYGSILYQGCSAPDIDESDARKGSMTLLFTLRLQEAALDPSSA